MKQKTKLYNNSFWYKERIDLPLEAIRNIFNDSSIVDIEKFVTKLCIWAGNEEPCRDYSFSEILHYLKQLEGLLNASHLIWKHSKKIKVSISEKEIFNPSIFCGDKMYITSWDYLPKILFLNEHIDPHKALERIFSNSSIEALRNSISTFATFAFDRGTLAESDSNINVLDTFLQINAITEAAHLICVRSSQSSPNI